MTDDQTVTQALKGCPFCGQAPMMEPWHGGAPTKVMIACPGLHPDDDIAPCEVAPQVTGETPAEAITAWNTRTAHSGEGRDFQSEVGKWMLACFGEEIAADKIERADRFVEEALELAQTIPGFTVERARALVEYVFGRPVGERGQEVGGVGVTLAALCNTYDLNIAAEWERELARVWTKVEAIRAKQAAKPTGSALPVAVSGEGRSNGAGEFVVAGPWEHHDETSGETHWSAEVQIVGGHASAAEVFGATAEEAKGRADMIAAALSTPQGEVERLREALERIATARVTGWGAEGAVKSFEAVRSLARATLAQPEGAKSE